MKKTFNAAFSLLLLGSLLAFASCQKDKEAVPEDALVSAEDQARLETEMESVQNFVDAEAADPDLETSNASKSGNLPSCATRTWNAATKTLTIDFGATNCLCKDGKLRRGQLVAVFNGPWQTAGATVTTTMVNYFVNDLLHTGTRLATVINPANTPNFKYRVAVQDASIAFADGTTRDWTALREVERVAGHGTPTLLDDEYLVTGSAQGTNRRGVAFNATIGQPLKKVFQVGCARNFVSGTITITNANQKTMLLNYDPNGTETCDKVASVTVNGQTRYITLR